MENSKWIPNVKGDNMNWSTYPENKEKIDSTQDGLFINPKVVCSDPKAKVFGANHPMWLFMSENNLILYLFTNLDNCYHKYLFGPTAQIFTIKR